MTEWRVFHVQDDGFFTCVQVIARSHNGDESTEVGAIQYTFNAIPQHGNPCASFAYPIYWH